MAGSPCRCSGATNVESCPRPTAGRPCGEVAFVARNAEIAKVGGTAVVDQDAGRVDRAVHDAASVRQRECRADVACKSYRIAFIESLPFDRIGQRAAANVTGDEIGGIGLAPVVIERHDVRVLEPGDQLGLSIESPDERRVVGDVRTQHGDRHLASHGGLVCAVRGPRFPSPIGSRTS